MQRYLPVNEDAAPDYPGADQDGPDEARAPIPSRPTTGWSYTGGHAAPPRAPPRKKKIRSDRGGRRGAGNGTEFLSREGGGRDRLVDEQRPVNRTENGRRTTKPEPLAEKRTIGEEPSERRGLHHKEDLPGGGGRVHGSRSGAGFGDEAHFNSDRNLPNHKNHYQANGKPSDKGSAARGTKTTSSVVEKARSESVLSCERYPRVAVSQSDGGYTGLSPRGYGAERGVEDDDQWDRVRPNERDLRTKRGPKAQVSTSADTSPLQSRLAQSMPSAVSGPADDREFSDGMDTFYVPAVGDADVERGGAAAHTREDLADLEFLDNDVLLSELERRFNEGQPYTYIGDSLVAVNPCKRLNIYTVECHTKYHDLGVRSKEAAHVFWVAAQVHRNLVLTATNQCVVLAGDSGAGKTESAKYILTHLVRCGSGRKSVSWFQTDRAPLTCDIVGRLEKVNLLLEQFGNASTVLNDNSSRFGKLLELGYDEYGVLITAHLECFILEKFRVTSRHPREKNFHIFYALFAGLSPARKAELGLDVEPETFRILAPCEPSDGGVFESEKKKAGYRQEELNSMLHHVGFTPQEISDLFKVLGAILHLSAIEFQIDADSFDDSVEITSAGKVYLGKALDVLGIGSAKVSTEFEKCLLELTIEVKGDKLGKPKTLRQAREGRDALVRELYSRLFYGIVEQINHNLRNDQTQQSTVNSQQSSVRPSSSELCIRLLDISGFENVVELNSFEQFIINSTSERLHQFFLHHTFRTELQEYIDEGVPEVTVKFVDNAQIVGLIFSRKPAGLIPLLEDVISTNGDDEGWLTKCKECHGQSDHFQSNSRTSFQILHYAGKVSYSATGFATKNNDTLPHNLKRVVQWSDNVFIKDSFSVASDAAAVLHPLTEGESKRTEKLTVRFTDQYLKSLSSMMKKLQTASPVFVRCIKPNSKLQAGRFDRDLVKQQLLSSGLLAVTKVRKDGYPVRIQFQHFAKRYKFLLETVDVGQSKTFRHICDDILSTAGVQGHQMGQHKVFLKMHHRDQLEEAMSRKTERVRQETAERERVQKESEESAGRETGSTVCAEAAWDGTGDNPDSASVAASSDRIPSCDSSETSGFASGHGGPSGPWRAEQKPPVVIPVPEAPPASDDEEEKEEIAKKKKEKQKKEGLGNQPAYNIFRVTERDFENSTEFEMKILRCARIIFFILFCLLNLVGCVVSRIALIWLSDQQLKNQDVNSLKPLWKHTSRKSSVQDFREGLVSTRLLLCLLLPLFVSWVACMFRVLFGRKDWPTLRAIVLVTLLDCAGVAGRSLFVFKVLQNVDGHVAVVLATAVCQVPGVVKLISVSRFGQRSWASPPDSSDSSPRRRWRRFGHYAHVLVLVLAVIVQFGVAPVVYFYCTVAAFFGDSEGNCSLRLPDLWTLVFSTWLSSVGWWENFSFGEARQRRGPLENAGASPAGQLLDKWCRLPRGWGELSALRVDYGRIRQTSFFYTGPVQIIVLVALFFRLTKGESGVSVNLLEQLDALFLSAKAGFGNWDEFSRHMSAYSLVYLQVAGTLVAPYVSGVACRLHMQRFSFAVPVVLSAPAALCLALFCTPSHLPGWFSLTDSCLRVQGDVIALGVVLAAGVLAFVSTVVINSHVWFPEVERTAKIDRLFAFPYRDPVFPDLCLQCSRRQDTLENLDRTQRHKKSEGNSKEGADRPLVYICATMWHELRHEMLQLLKSLFRVDFDAYTRKTAVKKFEAAEEFSDLYDPEIHVIFDDAFEMETKSKQKVLNTWVKQFIEVMPDALASVAKRNIDLKAPVKIPTPYGGRLLWTLPGGTRMYVHLKDKDRIRHRKRWSQILYLYYLLGFRLMADYETVHEALKAGGTIRKRRGHQRVRRNTSLLNIIAPEKIRQAENIFIMTLDGDVDFRPDAVHLLLDRMKKNKQVAAVCGRIHPVGDGPMVWYQQFEYAVGHWLQKAAEHVFGCVLCCPGCFSLLRASALMDDNVLRMYTTEPTEAMHFIQYEQGEDRWLCTLLLQQGWKIEYCAGADALTFAPETFNDFYIQRRRWSPSTMANIMDLIASWRVTVKMNDNISVLFMLYQFIMMTSGIFAPGLVVYMIAGSYNTVLGIGVWQSYLLSVIPVFLYVILCLRASNDTQISGAAILSAVYAIVMLLVTVGTIINVATSSLLSPDVLFLVCVAVIFVVAGIVHPKELFCLFHGLLYYITVPSTFVFLTVYFLCNIHVVTWGTREAPKAAAEPPNNSPSAGHADQGPARERGKLQMLFDKLGLHAFVQDIRAFIQSMMGIRQDLVQQQRQGASAQDAGVSNSDGPRQNQPAKVAPPPVPPEPVVETVEPDPTYWTRELDIPQSTVDNIDEKENKFWLWLIEEYLRPLKAKKKQQQKIKADLVKARNNVVFAYMLLNLMFTLMLLQFKLQMDKLKGAFYIAGQFEPVSTVFMCVVSMLLLIQFLGMMSHRWGTFLHLIASTSLRWFNRNDKEEMALTAIQETQNLTSAGAEGDLDLINPDYSEEEDSYEPGTAATPSPVATAHRDLAAVGEEDDDIDLDPPDYSDGENETDFGGRGQQSSVQYDSVFEQRYRTVRKHLERRGNRHALHQRNNSIQQPQPHRWPARFNRGNQRQLDMRQSLYTGTRQHSRRNNLIDV